MDKQKQDSWSMLKEELAKKGFDSCQIQEIYFAIVETCDRRGTTSIRIWFKMSSKNKMIEEEQLAYNIYLRKVEWIKETFTQMRKD